jgi:hypothetical protein
VVIASQRWPRLLGDGSYGANLEPGTLFFDLIDGIRIYNRAVRQ